MARISDEILAKIKKDVSLLRLIEQQGHKLKKHGKDYAICCLFHEEKTASCIISQQKNVFNCFGCGESGTVIDWVMKTQNLSFRNAVTMLQQDAGMTVEIEENTSSQTTLQPLASDLSDNALLNTVIDYYHDALKQSAEALDYLKKRGLHHPELISTFKLGYANRTLGYRLPKKNIKAGKAIREQLQRIGIYRESGHEHFTGSLIVPVLDTINNVCEVYGRKILDTKLRKGTPMHLYLPNKHIGVWNEKALLHSDEVIICEALIDAMTFWVHGFRHVTASYGTQGFTKHHQQLFLSAKIKRVLIAYDRDSAGDAASKKLADSLNRQGIDAFRILLPKDQDVNQYALEVENPQQALSLLIRKAEFMGQAQSPERQQPLASIDTIELNDEKIQPHYQAVPEPDNIKVMPDTAPAIEAQVNEREIIIKLGDRVYKIRGLNKNNSYDQLKVNLLASRKDFVHVDSFDLYQARPRQMFINQASKELGVEDQTIKKDLGKILIKLEELQEQQINDQLNVKEESPTLSDDDREQALALLKDPKLLERILSDFNTAGVVGEETNKLIGYLACVSRKLDRPLAVIIQSSSAAGKSSLMEAILNLVPEEERVQYSAMTGQSLFYMGETNLKHKILAIAEEEGAENASYALKLLQSEGELTIASTGKDDTTGDLVTKEYRVEGPVMLFLTTTAIDIDEELMNRCMVLTVNESREQTLAIHNAQRQQQTLQGLLKNEDKKHITQLHRNAQRLLQPLLVANPFAEQLTFINDKTRTRRDHMKYLTLIRAIALLHQYQREIKSVQHNGQWLRYIEVIPKDIEVANDLAHLVLGRSLDELPPQTRTLLMSLHKMVKQVCDQHQIDRCDYRFTRKEIRAFNGWSDFQVRTHLARLVELEYVLTHRGGRGQSFVYELIYDGSGQDNGNFLSGLIDVNTLKVTYDEKFEGLNSKNDNPTSIQSAPKKPLVSTSKIA